LHDALKKVGKTEERYYEPELHRLKAELLPKSGDGSTAEAQSCFQSAIDLARTQDARSWELRATTSLGRLLVREGRRDEARAMLQEIYNWFTEVFDAADLKDAETLLDELSA
jgi:predicted ATPase